MKPEQELESGSQAHNLNPSRVGEKHREQLKQVATNRDIWISYKKLAGIQEAFSDTMPRDLLAISTCFFAKETVDIWREQHKDLRVTPGEFLAHLYLSDYAWNMISCWLRAYNPDKEKPYHPYEDLEYYSIPEHPFLVHLKDSRLWVALAPRTIPRKDASEQRTICPKDGRIVSEMKCTFCSDQPEGSDPEDTYSACRDYNTPKEAVQ